MPVNIEEILRFGRPELYEKSTAKFWDDEHISKGMLEAHLDPDLNSATRKAAFVEKSVEWIFSIAPPTRYPRLLDLGCGPGIYAEKFAARGYKVLGVDLSERSINYARSRTRSCESKVEYVLGSYLDMDYRDEFDIATLIYCDFGTFSDRERKQILRNVAKALKPQGKLIFDVFTPEAYKSKEENKTWSCLPNGFWSDSPHLCLESFYRYDETNTFLNQAIVASGTKVVCYNIWEHTFTAEELESDLSEANLKATGFYGDIAGAARHPGTGTLCVTAEK